jgi:hypothetical protein
VSQASQAQPLPLWRAVAGFAVLGCLLVVALAIAPVYLANYQLSQYVRGLAAQADVAQTSDERFRAEIVDRAHQLHLPLQVSDVIVNHEHGRVQLRVAKYKAQAYHADLHFSGFSTQ